MADLESFRAEARAWLEANCPPEKRGKMHEDDHFFGGRNASFKDEPQRLWFERMLARGWTAPEWPEEYGGGGLDAPEAAILEEEMARIQAHRPLTSLGLLMLGWALLKFGTEAQKQQHLPPIVRGEIWWCQGYSEPNAGSDLVNLQTRAVLEGDEFVVTGQKIWTSYGHLADWTFCLVRTDPERPRHAGISFLLIDMRSPGVSPSPLRLISGLNHFSQVFYDEVRVPRENLVSELNRGWDVAKYLLLFERAMIGGARPDDGISLLDFAKLHLGPDGLDREPYLRTQLVAIDMELAAYQALVERYASETEAGVSMGAKSSMLKYFATDLFVKRNEIMLSILGTAGLDRDAETAHVSTGWLNSITHKMGGGSSEIQLNIVAKRVLELPGA
ncbi:acyl-CoA dehydrogenase family protein [Sphingomonas sp.]|uniref:acyl-CoA dehydrogenase family protein n=1 Tax=Sphingomonas sp. TaxID=28214 RepID=UPI003AFFB383